MFERKEVLFVVPAMNPRMKEESIGTLILAKKALLAGFTPEIVRYWNVGISPRDNYPAFCNQFVLYLLNYHPSVICFYCRCEEYHICIDLTRRIKEKDSSVFTVFGGPQAELVAKETLCRFPSVDFVCCSEGENTIVPFLSFLLSKNPGLSAESIAGLTYRDENGTVLQNDFPRFLPDGYRRPFYYYDLIPSTILNNCKNLQIDVGRGCPFSCTFCSTKTFWKRKYRLRSIPDIVDEIEYVLNNYGIRSFDFIHDLFTVSKERIRLFCEEIRNRGLQIDWGCDSRIDTIDAELVDMMVANGLTHVFFGIETGSPRMQKITNKRLNLSQCDQVIRYCLSKGLKVTTSFIYGFPDETEDDLDLTLKMAIKFQNYGCIVLTNLCHIMNGTEMYAQYKDKLVLYKGIAFNDCIPAFYDLYDIIEPNKDLFANFCDYPNELRNELKYLDVFRYMLHYAYIDYPEAHAVLYDHDYGSLSMYRLFCQTNKSFFETGVFASDGNVTHVFHAMKHTPSKIYRKMVDNLLSSYN